MKYIYFLLFLIGTILPYQEFIGFVVDNGLDVERFFDQLLATQISRFFAYDVLISAVTLIAWILKEKTTVKNHWLPILTTLLLGVSAGLPLFLYQKELNRTPSLIH